MITIDIFLIFILRKQVQKMKTKFSILIFATILLMIVSCKKNPTTTIPTLTTTDASAITITNAQSGGIISSDGGATITARGICWGTNTAPTLNDSKTSDGTGTGTFTSSLSALTANTTYYVRAYATNSVGTAYGNTITFKTSPLVLPTLTTTVASAITLTTAASGGNISADGGATITARGVCWSTTQNPTTANSKTSDGTGTGTFTSSLIGLTANTTYYVRAYATNSVGTVYANQISVTTLSPTLAILTTTAASSITQTTATSGGNISSDGGATITARGACFSTTQNPTTANSKTSDGTGTGAFISSLTGLTPSATYYLRAYATNSVGTTYGNQISFTTLSGSLPTVLSNTISNVTVNSASVNSSINSDGGASITAKGICWSPTSQSPTINDNKTIDGTGTASFVSNIMSLLPNTIYYVRSYATNAVGTSYGMANSFATKGDGSYGTVTDFDGNVYHTITIGTQVWMVENLKVTHYSDGTPIINSTSAAASAYNGTYSNYNNDNNNVATYGRLYDWYAVNNGHLLCPGGWHVPTDLDWSLLQGYSYLGGAYQSNPSAGNLKEAGTSHWQTPNTGGTNQTGFTGLPGGMYNGTIFQYINLGANWWSANGDKVPPNASASSWSLSSILTTLSKSTNAEWNQLSVRCIKN